MAALITAIDLVRDLVPFALVVAVVPTQWMAIALLAQAHLVRQGIGWDWPKLLLGLSAPLSVHFFFFVIEPVLAVRLAQSFVVCGLLLSVTAIRLFGAAKRDKSIDRIIAAAVAFCAVFYLIRAFAVPGNAGFSDADWVGSVSMLAMYFGNALAALAVALLLMLAIGMDVIAVHFRETRIDPLTGIGNRRALDDAIAADGRDGAALGAAMMIDLDRFKAINDDLGHAIGDEVLIAVAQALDQKLGALGVLVRVGGEEFAVLIPADRIAAARSMALVAHSAVGAVEIAGLDRPLSVSIGLGLRRADEAMRDTLRRADIALYRAKSEGRNRLVMADDVTPGRAVA